MEDMVLVDTNVSFSWLNEKVHMEAIGSTVIGVASMGWPSDLGMTGIHIRLACQNLHGQESTVVRAVLKNVYVDCTSRGMMLYLDRCICWDFGTLSRLQTLRVFEYSVEWQ